MKTIDLSEKFAGFTDRWAPKIVGQLNDYHVKLVKIKGEFVWHSHPETDELFLVLVGEMVIDFREGESRLSAGDMVIIPKGVSHRPRASDECHIVLIEPAGTRNTGDAGGELTAEGDVWI
jgi:mannose-6-phosphate isomerase-like protein (cupin superfamily)